MACDIQLTVQTDDALLRFAVDAETGKLKLLEMLTPDGSPVPSLVTTDPGSLHVGLARGVAGNFTVRACMTMSPERKPL